MAKIIINYNEDEYVIEKNLKKQLKKNSKIGRASCRERV